MSSEVGVGGGEDVGGRADALGGGGHGGGSWSDLGGGGPGGWLGFKLADDVAERTGAWSEEQPVAVSGKARYDGLACRIVRTFCTSASCAAS